MFFPFRDLNPSRRTPLVTYGLVAANVLVFLWLNFLPDREQQRVVMVRGFVPARIGQLVQPRLLEIEVPREQIQTPRGVVVRVDRYQLPPARQQILTSLLTCMFLHGGWWHLIGNMWFLWIFGNNVEDRLGHVTYLLFYLGGGMLATGTHWLIGPTSTTPVIGASGAVATVLGAYAVTWPWARVQTIVFLFIFFTIIEVPALFVLGFWFVGQLLEATHALNLPGNALAYTSGVAWWAHIGGFVAGALLMPIASDLLGTGRTEPSGVSGREDAGRDDVDLFSRG